MSEPKLSNLTIDKGASVGDVDQSTHNTSHTVIYQGGAVEEKIREESRDLFRSLTRRYISNGIITEEVREILYEKAYDMKLSNVDRDAIIEEARSFVQKQKSLSEINRKRLDEAEGCVFRNSDIASALRTLQALSNKCSDEEVDFFYNMVMSAKQPETHVNQYKRRKTDSYWQTYWVYLSYVKLKRYDEAETMISDLDNFGGYPPANVIPLLTTAGKLARSYDVEATKVPFDENSCGEVSGLLNMLKKTVAYVTVTGRMLSNNGYLNFYLENFFNVKAATATARLEPQAPPQPAPRPNGYSVEGDVSRMIEKKIEKAVEAVIVKAVPQPAPQPAPQPVREAPYNRSFTGTEGRSTGARTSNRKAIYIGIAVAAVLAVFLMIRQTSVTPKPAVEPASKPATVQTSPAKPAASPSTTQKTTSSATAKPKTANTANTATTTAKASSAPSQKATPAPAPKPVSPDQMSPEDAYSKGKMLLGNGNFSSAALYLKSAADRGSAAASYEVGLMYKSGSGVAASTTSAFTYMKTAAEAGFSKAFRELGEMYHGGRGTDKDRSEAEYWYRKAADAGDARALRLLNNM